MTFLWLQTGAAVLGALVLGAGVAVALLQYVILPLSRSGHELRCESSPCSRAGVYLEEEQLVQVDTKLAELKKLNRELEEQRGTSKLS